MSKEKILVVDDEKDILELVKYNLEKAGYSVMSAKSGGEALDIIDIKPSLKLIILDIMLPGLNGLEILKRIKKDKEVQSIPVIMLTAKGEESDIIEGLRLGADDYITKPFSIKVLIERINVILRRAKQDARHADVLEKGDIKVNLSTYETTVKNIPVKLTSIEFKLLAFLMENSGKPFTREQLLDNVWGDEIAVVDRAVDVHITWLRQKLGKYGSSIETIRGIGYKFKG
ncbi:MAG: response regulator transcription factor [Elusimicrobia bacterium]|nr:response regulator transcription factor [Elusimicrobiota bacterium]